jgi:hypothetical protein
MKRGIVFTPNSIARETAPAYSGALYSDIIFKELVGKLEIGLPSVHPR